MHVRGCDEEREGVDAKRHLLVYANRHRGGRKQREREMYTAHSVSVTNRTRLGGGEGPK
jgi:hypothetical protein